jgi:hypothetical protein
LCLLRSFSSVRVTITSRCRGSAMSCALGGRVHRPPPPPARASRTPRACVRGAAGGAGTVQPSACRQGRRSRVRTACAGGHAVRCAHGCRSWASAVYFVTACRVV